MNIYLRQVAAAAALLAAGSSYAAVGDTLSYSFNTPSAVGGVASVSQAMLLLTETTQGVDFVLTPNWPVSSGSFIEQLAFNFSGDAFTFVDGPGPDPLSFGTDSGSIDAGYATGGLFALKWADAGSDRFDASHPSAAWSMNGPAITLDDFSVLVTSLTKPSPAFGVLTFPDANVPKWVAGPGTLVPVPEPATYALMALGLGVMAAAARRQRKAQ